MKMSPKRCVLVLFLWLLAVAGIGVAAAQPNPANSGYLQDSSGNVVKNAEGRCWRTGYWTPQLATQECDPEYVKTPPPPPPPGPEKPAFEKMTLQAETLFGFDKATLRPSGKKTLNGLVKKMADYPQVELILVSGYTDRIGSDEYNLKLSQRRANTVKRYLVSQGIESGRIETKAMGKADPVVSCSDVKGRANRHNKKLIECLQPNRRVVVQIKVQRPTGAESPSGGGAPAPAQ